MQEPIRIALSLEYYIFMAINTYYITQCRTAWEGAINAVINVSHTIHVATVIVINASILSNSYG